MLQVDHCSITLTFPSDLQDTEKFLLLNPRLRTTGVNYYQSYGLRGRAFNSKIGICTHTCIAVFFSPSNSICRDRI